MKILFFTPYFYPYISGMTVYSRLLLKELNKKHKVEVLAFKHDPDLSSKDYVDDLIIHRMSYFFRVSKGFISPQSLPFFFKKIKKKELVIVNLPSVEAIFLIFFAKLFKINVLAIFYCHIYLGQSFSKRLLSFIVNHLVKLQLYLSDYYLTFSKDYIDNLSWSERLKNKAIYVKPLVNQVKQDISFFNKLKLKKKNQCWIGFVGRISKEKGLDYLVDAIEQLPNNQKYTLVIVGPKKDQVAGEIKFYVDFLKKIKKSKINCLFLGILTDQELFAFYHVIDLLVLPSTNSTEAYGLVQLEAMSVGTPVIASDLPGVREAIRLFQMGELIPAKNITELSSAIIKVKDLKSKPSFIERQKDVKEFIVKNFESQVFEKIFDRLQKH